jgi:uncharacterized membrane protein
VGAPSRDQDLPRREPSAKAGRTARFRVSVAAAAGAGAAALAAGVFGAFELAPLIGWDSAALVFVIWTWTAIWGRDAEATARLALLEDPTRAITDALLLAASVVSLLAVGLVLVEAGNRSGAAQLLQVALSAFSVVLSWTLVHTVYTLTYARLYYAGGDGGIGFNEDGRPAYADFTYVAFTIGMTFQVSDTPLQTKQFRAAALRQALLSYLFGTVIVATTINLVVSLSR